MKYLFDHPEQKRAYHRFYDSLPSTSIERLTEMILELEKKPEEKYYLEAVKAELQRKTQLVGG